jgi:hydroxymethylbilane synthase
MPSHPVIIGTRGSALALAQTRWVAARLQALHPGLTVDLRIIHTRGDRIRDVALSRVGGKGLFTKELEGALLAGEIDLAVHSLKDLPTELPPGLTLAAVPERADPHDVLVLPAASAGTPGSPASALSNLPAGARVGSSSLRRQAQLRRARPDLQWLDLRGNLDTRLRKLDAGECEALVLAAAGLIRLGWSERIAELLPFEICLPAAGQGALGLECRSDDAALQELLRPLNHPDTWACVAAERAFLAALGGGCQVPLGVVGTVAGSQLHLQGLVARLDGQWVRNEVVGEKERAEEWGTRLAARLLQEGAAAILPEGRGWPIS